MAKGGSRKSAEDDAIARRAARVRKQRGRTKGGPKTQESDNEYTSLAVLHRKAVARTEFNNEIERKFIQHRDQIDSQGSTIVQDYKVIRKLKDHYKGTNTRWSEVDNGTAFAKARR